jgi:hypothetical protein
MASSSRLTAQEVLTQILQSDSESSDSDVIDQDSDEEVDNVLSTPASSDVSANDDESDSNESEVDSSASHGRSLVAPSGKRWNLDVPNQTRTLISTITLPASLTNRSRNIKTEIDSFQLFMSDDIVQVIIDSTNKFAKSKVANWRDVDDVELSLVF